MRPFRCWLMLSLLGACVGKAPAPAPPLRGPGLVEAQTSTDAIDTGSALSICEATPTTAPPAALPVHWVDTNDRASNIGLLEVGVAPPPGLDPMSPRFGQSVHQVSAIGDEVLVLWQCGVRPAPAEQCKGSYQRTGIGCDPVPLPPGPECTGSPGLHLEAISSRSGKTLWDRVLAGPDFALIGRASVAIDKQGAPFVAAHFSGTIAGPNDAASAAGEMGTFVAALSKTGELRWVHTTGGPAMLYYWGPVLAPDERGGVLLAAQVSTKPNQKLGGEATIDNDVQVEQLDNAGQSVWTHRIGGSGYRDEPTSLVALADGGAIVGGNIEFSGVEKACASTSQAGGFVEGLDASGKSLWLSRLHGGVGALVKSGDSVLAVLNVSEPATSAVPEQGAYLAALSKTGHLQWQAPLCAFANETYTYALAQAVSWPRPGLVGMCMGPSAVTTSIPPRRFRIGIDLP